MDHLREALNHCKYPKWAIDRVERRFSKSASEENKDSNTQGTADTNPNTNEVKIKGHIVIPYTQGLCENIKKICSKYGIQTHLKGNSTIKNFLVSPKDKEPIKNQSGAIYWFLCGDLACDEEYIGKTSKTFGEMFTEHLKGTLPYTLAQSQYRPHHHTGQLPSNREGGPWHCQSN